jgi:hypothetical protein
MSTVTGVTSDVAAITVGEWEKVTFARPGMYAETWLHLWVPGLDVPVIISPDDVDRLRQMLG